MKRLLDLITAVFLLLLTFPLLLAVGLAIRLDSPGPIFTAKKEWGLVVRPSSCSSFVA